MNNRFVEIKKQLGKFIANFSVTEEDGKEYIFDGESIHEGLSVSTYDEKGDVVPLEDGEYTIQGVRVKMLEGKVSELVADGGQKQTELSAEEAAAAAAEANPENGNLLNTETKVEVEKEEVEKKPEEKEVDSKDKEIEELKSQVSAKDKEIEDLKKELEELKKKPLAAPVPQRTDMGSHEAPYQVPESVKGSSVEDACRIFGSR